MKDWIKKHATKKRVISVCSLALVTSTVLGYRAYSQPSADPTYVTAAARRGLLIVSITGTGQVSGESQLDLKPKASASIIAIPVKQGQEVKQGDIIVQLDRTAALKAVRDANQSVRDAAISLASAKLSLAKLKQPPTAAALLQAQDAVNQAKRALDKLNQGANAYDLQQAENAVPNAYASSLIALKSAMQSLQKSLLDADNVLAVDHTAVDINFANVFSMLDQGKKSLAITNYPLVKGSIASAKAVVDALPSENPNPTDVDAAMTTVKATLQKMYDLLGLVTDALHATLTSSSFSQSSLDALISTIQSDRTDTSSKLSSILSQEQSIQQAKTALEKIQQPADAKDVAAAEEIVKEAEQRLADLKAGPMAVDLAIAQNGVDQRVSSLVTAQNKLRDAQAAVDDSNVRAPFDGVIAKLVAQIGDSASPGSAVATLIAKTQVAVITLNEVDAAKVKVGQKTTLTFDAVDGLSLTGEVAEVATLGTVAQGVVNYDVKIAFDTQDARIRPGMSVRAAIITDTKADAILVPNAAVKSGGGQAYVQLLDATSSTADTNAPVQGTPRRQAVETGLANDTETEITSGVHEGDRVVVQTIQPASAKSSAANASSAVRIPGLTGGSSGGGGFRGAAGGR